MEAAYNLWEKGCEATDAGDYVRGVRLFRKAVSLGNVSAIHDLALAYDEGKGVKKNKLKALKLYKIAARLGNDISFNNIAILYREWGNIDRTRFWFKKGLTSGDYDCAVDLAKSYLSLESRINFRRALEYLNIALQGTPQVNIFSNSYEEARHLKEKIESKIDG